MRFLITTQTPAKHFGDMCNISQMNSFGACLSKHFISYLNLTLNMLNSNLNPVFKLIYFEQIKFRYKRSIN